MPLQLDEIAEVEEIARRIFREEAKKKEPKPEVVEATSDYVVTVTSPVEDSVE